jgi:pimeloyl-ACP methyl ester carboxylesterase
MALGRWMLDAFGRVQMEKHWVQVEGHRMHSLKAGLGPDLILVHGLLGTASAWDPVIPHLAEESTVYAVDALGIGEASTPVSKPRLTAWSRLWTSPVFVRPTSWPLPMGEP